MLLGCLHSKSDAGLWHSLVSVRGSGMAGITTTKGASDPRFRASGTWLWFLLFRIKPACQLKLRRKCHLFLQELPTQRGIPCRLPVFGPCPARIGVYAAWLPLPESSIESRAIDSLRPERLSARFPARKKYLQNRVKVDIGSPLPLGSGVGPGRTPPSSRSMFHKNWRMRVFSKEGGIPEVAVCSDGLWS